MPNPKRLEPREIVAEIHQLGGEIEQRLSRIFELSDVLYGSVRHGHFRQERDRLDNDLRLIQERLSRAVTREEPQEMVQQLQTAARKLERQLEAHGEIVPAYTMFANAWKRTAGSMHTGLRRNASVQRLVLQVERKHGVAQVAETRPHPAAPATGGGVEELVELYGEEAVRDHASS